MRNSSESLPIKRKPRAISTFLKKTFQLLNDDENIDVVRWASNGIGFIVLNQDRFSKEILPKYFKHSNYSSFVRQLNMYNFHKIRQNNSQSYFHHLNFDRSNQNKLSQIKRKPEKKKRKNDESEDEIVSDQEQKQMVKSLPIKKIKEDRPFKLQNSDKKIQSQKNTRHFFSSEQCHQQKENINIRQIEVQEIEDDKISINNQISQRIIPRITTRQLIYPSINNLFPFGGGKTPTSTFCLFY